MRSLGLVLALCGAAALIGASSVASAFETQGSGDPIDGQSLLVQPQSLAQDLKAHSLAMPLGGKPDSGGFVSSYGTRSRSLGLASISRSGPLARRHQPTLAERVFFVSAAGNRRCPRGLSFTL